MRNISKQYWFKSFFSSLFKLRGHQEDLAMFLWSIPYPDTYLTIIFPLFTIFSLSQLPRLGAAQSLPRLHTTPNSCSKMCHRKSVDAKPQLSQIKRFCGDGNRGRAVICQLLSGYKREVLLKLLWVMKEVETSLILSLAPQDITLSMQEILILYFLCL